MRLRMLKPAVQTLGSAAAPVPTMPTVRRPTANTRGYTYRWQQYRAAWLREHPLCGDREGGTSPEHSDCARVGRATAATDVDHIQRVTGPDDPLFWERSNHQSLCHGCHSAKTASEEAASRDGCTVGPAAA